MTLQIRCDLMEYDPDPTHTVTGSPEFLRALIYVTCSRCSMNDQASTLSEAEEMAKQHADITGHG